MTEVTIAYIVGVVVFYRAAEHFSMEVIQIYRENIIRFQLASGGRR